MKFAFIDAQKAHYPVEVQCSVLGVSRSGYYAARARPASEHVREDVRITSEIRRVFRQGRGTYGSPRVHAELRARGVRVGRKRVERLMRAEGLHARRGRAFHKTTDSRHAHPIAPNVLARDFDADAPNTAWVTDVTFVRTAEGWLYLAVILDLFSRRVVGWSVSETNDTMLALRPLEIALQSRRPRGELVHHSDRGSPYASEAYRARLALAGLVGSMSRAGDCWDNAVAESFFGTLKGERLDRELFATHAQATRAIGEYIDGFYNPTRRHSALGYFSPIEFELKAHVATLAA